MLPKKRPVVGIARPRAAVAAQVAVHASLPPSTVASSVSSRRGSVDGGDDDDAAAGGAARGAAAASSSSSAGAGAEQSQLQRVRISAERARQLEEGYEDDEDEGGGGGGGAGGAGGGGAQGAAGGGAGGEGAARPRSQGMSQPELGGYFLTGSSGGAGSMERLASLGGARGQKRLRDLLWNEVEGLPSTQSVQLQALAERRLKGEKPSMYAAPSSSSSSSAAAAAAAAYASSGSGGGSYVPQARVEVVGKNIVVVRESMQHNIKTLRGSSAVQLGDEGEEGGGEGEDYAAPSSGPAGGPSLAGLPIPPPPGGRVSVLRAKRPRVARWCPEETRAFYSALRFTGLDFTLMEAYFPGRDRKQLKAKYDVEEKMVRGGARGLRAGAQGCARVCASPPLAHSSRASPPPTPPHPTIFPYSSLVLRRAAPQPGAERAGQ